MALVNKVWCDVLALTCDAHVVPMESIRQAISHHGVLHGGVSHLHAHTHLYSVGSLRDQRRSVVSELDRNSLKLYVYLSAVLHLPGSCFPSPLPRPQWTLPSGWIGPPDTRPSAQSHKPSDSSRLGPGKGYLPQHWPGGQDSAHDLARERRKEKGQNGRGEGRKGGGEGKHRRREVKLHPSFL